MRQSPSEVLLIFFVLFLEASQLCLCENLTDNGCIDEERQALLKFRDSFESCSRHVLAWGGKHCCRWKGVKCDAITGHVVTIDLSPKIYSMDELATEPPINCTLSMVEELTSGSFVTLLLSSKAMSTSLLMFKYLNHLDLSFIDYQSSPIPLFLGSMKQLRYLNLSNCYFYGKVPQHLQNLTDLQILDLSDSLFYPMDDFIWVSHLSSLQYIDMSGVAITKEINSMMQVIHNLPLLLQAHFDVCQFQSSKMSHDFVNSSTLPSKLQVLSLRGNFLNAIPIAIQNISSLTLLDISGNNLDSVPLWLGESPFLSHLNLAWNKLTGLFPIALQNISSLKFLDLSNNHLTSAVPLWFIKRVHHVILTNNKFSTLEGSCLWNSKINCNVKSLDSLPDNKSQRETFESFKNISVCTNSDLQTLDLSHNELKGLTESLGQLKNLVHLNLASNLLYGPIPLTFRNMTKLGELILEDNQLNGTIPAFFGKLQNLRNLDLSGNHLSGIIPDDLRKLVNLRTLDLSGNHLSGIIPDDLRKLVNLRTLDLSGNHLSGIIPDDLRKLVNLRTLDLSGNHLSGIIPDDLRKLVNLRALDLSNNSLEGTLKEIHLDNMSYLQDLRIGHNKLSMKLAPNWLPPFQLANLQLQSCKIDTPFPQWLQTQKKLDSLYLSDTGIWGTFPKWFYQKDLSVLDVSNNKISGQLPRNLHDMMPFLNSFFISNNRLNGSIPKSLCKLQILFDLDLSKNKLSNEIPGCLGEVSGIVLIDLSSNELSGTIPESFCGSYGSYLLQSLNLSNNSLHGELPSTLQSCNILEVLDLGNNELHGIIPSSIWADTSVLKILRLRQNKFSGTIPLSLCQLSILQSLDLASNNLIGTIPFCLGNLQGMIASDKGSMRFLAPRPTNDRWPSEAQVVLHPNFDQWDKEDVKQLIKGRELDFTKNLKFVVNLDLSNNSLVGFIPEVLMSLTKLVGLNLSHNYLSGEIPSKIGKLKLLESLDLSWNQLAGPLPSSMSSLTSLSHLNLSYNNFSGPIPEGNQFLTLEDAFIYVGNKYLCGEPVLIKCHNNDNNEAPTCAHYEKMNQKEKILFYFVVAIGYMTGFWGIIALLVFNKSLRYVCFRYIENIADEMYVAVVIRVARLKRIGLKPW